MVNYGPGFCVCTSFRRSDCRSPDACKSLLYNLASRPTVGWASARWTLGAAVAAVGVLVALALTGCAHVGPEERRPGGAVYCRPVRVFPWLTVDRYECRAVLRPGKR